MRRHTRIAHAGQSLSPTSPIASVLEQRNEDETSQRANSERSLPQIVESGPQLQNSSTDQDDILVYNTQTIPIDVPRSCVEGEEQSSYIDIASNSSELLATDHNSTSTSRWL